MCGCISGDLLGNVLKMNTSDLQSAAVCRLEAGF
jgi:hypothetical protein